MVICIQVQVPPGTLPQRQPSLGGLRPGPTLDTSRVTYLREESPGYFYLRTMKPDGSGDEELWGERILLHGRLGFQSTSYAFTADGRTLVYSDREGTYTKQRGRERRKISDAIAGALEVSPDGRKLVYTRYTTETGLDVYTSNLDGTGERRLTDAPRDDTNPFWSPDGRKILYTEGLNEWLMTMNADGTGKRAFSEDISPGGLRLGQASWSPDGRQLLAIGYQRGEWHVYTLSADATMPRKLSSGALQHFTPRWSPDGTRILFAQKSSSRSDATNELFLMNRDGSALTRITATPTVSEVRPKWLPSTVTIPVSR